MRCLCVCFVCEVTLNLVSDSACEVSLTPSFVLTSMLIFILALALSACSAIPPLFDMVPLGERGRLFSPPFPPTYYHGCPFGGGHRIKQRFKCPQECFISEAQHDPVSGMAHQVARHASSPTFCGSKTSPTHSTLGEEQASLAVQVDHMIFD